ncbi:MULTISPECIES: glycine oxidase ThiO [Shouchella]|uniref:glycine oxidase n=2 Tax=Shouchella TaxID=2893057 RepID=Q5WH84_SHOC1|nr:MULTISPECIES: glycine oxidase ThiO [Shouchella]MCM3312507.1 glycine oxidase ThiO [Psychrobacillus sp. MER TA 17]MDO7282986.1 glycine oxidase ThiO [Shouchella clausii]MDO7303083.1 glycine oxidase ThiO [Shouchella clausii]SHL01393.1 glycine oxidase [Shouchella rhizosphaerae]BAD64271.1 glycine oxidase [Shouchella clausii KSM-K16]
MEHTIVLGGGVIGLSVAFQLAMDGKTVSVLEINTCGGQASGAAAGMLAPYSEISEDPDDFFRLCLASLRAFKEWQASVKQESGMTFEFTESGSLHCVYHEADLLSLATRKAWQEEFGAKVDVLTREELKKKEPELAEDIIGAIHYPEEAHVYAPDYVKALQQACRNRGVHIYEQLKHVSLVKTEPHIELQSASGQRFTADQLVVATGAWAKELESQLGLNLPIYPIRGQICAYNIEPGRIRHILYTSQGYLVPKANGTLVNGASEDIAGFQTEITDKGIRRLTNWNHKIVPFLAELTPFHKWAGLRPATQDGYPLIGFLRNHPRVFMACGHYRNGILLSAITAKVASAQLAGQKPPVPIALFDPDRFS